MCAAIYTEKPEEGVKCLVQVLCGRWDMNSDHHGFKESLQLPMGPSSSTHSFLAFEFVLYSRTGKAEIVLLDSRKGSSGNSEVNHP